MNSEPMNAQTGGEANAQIETENIVHLEKSEQDAGAQEQTGAGSAASEGNDGTKGAATDERTSDETTDGKDDPESAAQAAEAPGDAGSASEEEGADGKPEDPALARGRLAEARLGFALLHGALEAAGIPKARLDYAARLIDASDIDPLADGAAAAYAEKVQKLVTDIPELKPAVPTGTTGSAGEHARKHENPEADTAARFRGGMGL